MSTAASHTLRPAGQRLFIEMYDLVILDDDGNWKVIESAVTYEDADYRLDLYTDQFPHAIADIIPHRN